MALKPHILYYNWIPFDDDEKRGGGVSIYQANLIEALTRDGWQVDFFSAGQTYDIESLTPRFERTHNVFDPACRSFQLVNSPILSPGHSAFGQNARLFEKGPAFDAFMDFLDENGPYDIVHFNNIEGIPFSFLDLKERHPDTLVVLSHHNYFAVCPQVNLWHHETAPCTNFDQGRKCVDCLPHRQPRAAILAAHQLATLLRRSGLTAKSPAFVKAFHSGTVQVLEDLARRTQPDFIADDPAPRLPAPSGTSTGFALRRHHAVETLNRSVDLHLAVSERVARMITRYGVDPARTQVSYIGTKHGKTLAHSRKHTEPANPDRLSMIFMGYMRADKGFYFLLDALERLPDALARRLHLRLAARSDNKPVTRRRLAALSRRLGRLELVDGYGHDEIPILLEDIDIGVVPVLWEDNLPQVALEIMSHGIPILAADRGGAQELAANPDFTFPAGSPTGFNAALGRLIARDVPLARFWDNAMALRSMGSHLDELTTLYRTTPHEHRLVPPAPRAPGIPTETVASAAELLAALPPGALAKRVGLHG